MNDNYSISNMSFTDLKRVVTWAEQAGWNPGLYDAKCFYHTDPKGFFIGKLNGQAIASGSAVIYDDKFAFCGFYMVQNEFRKQGFGLALTKHRLDYVGSRNVGIDGVMAMVEQYKNLGYEIAHHNIRYMGKGPIPLNSRLEVRPISSVSFKEICVYDRLHFPAAREKFLRCWLHQIPGIGYAVVQNSQLVGYGYIRPSTEGFRIGPLFANTQDIADALFTNLVQHAGSCLFFMDSPAEVNLDAQALAKHYHLKETFESARMYLKYEPDIAIKQVYGITSLELG